MSSLSQFTGGARVPKVIAGNNENAITGTNPVAAIASAAARRASNVRQILSGALVASTYKTLLSVSGGGLVNFLALQVLDATSRGVDMRVTIDGTVVATVSSITAVQVANGAYVAIGSVDASSNTSPTNIFDPTPFNTSLLVEVRSTLGETDKLAIATNYRTF